MATYIALLRGVNIGRNTLKMDRLRAICSELAVKNARTYLRSGNVVLEAHGTAVRWAEALKQRLRGETRLPVSVIAKTAEEMGRVIAENPFLKKAGIDAAKLYVTFLQKKPAKNALAALGTLKSGADRWHCASREIYLHCPISNNAIEKALSVRSTTRNWSTIRQLYQLSTE